MLRAKARWRNRGYSGYNGYTLTITYASHKRVSFCEESMRTEDNHEKMAEALDRLADVMSVKIGQAIEPFLDGVMNGSVQVLVIGQAEDPYCLEGFLHGGIVCSSWPHRHRGKEISLHANQLDWFWFPMHRIIEMRLKGDE